MARGASTITFRHRTYLTKHGPHGFCHLFFALWQRFFIAFGGGNANFVPKMPDEHPPELNQPGPRKRSTSRRRGRRGGRGRSLRPAHAVAPSAPGPAPTPNEPTSAPSEEHPHDETGAETQPAERAHPEPQPAARPRPEQQTPQHAQQHAPPSLAKAADEVRRIVESLEEALEQMEHVLELVELAEEQKIGDEREIENLRRALRRIQAPRHEPQRDRRAEHPREERPRENEDREGHRPDESRREEPSREPEHEGGGEPPPEEFGSEEQSS